jgi:hypothetical protein
MTVCCTVPLSKCSLCWGTVTRCTKFSLRELWTAITTKFYNNLRVHDYRVMGQNTRLTTRRSTVRTTEPPPGKIADFRSSLLSCTSTVWYPINSFDTETRVTNGTSSYHRQVLTSVRTPPSSENDIWDKFSTGTRPGYNNISLDTLYCSTMWTERDPVRHACQTCGPLLAHPRPAQRIL